MFSEEGTKHFGFPTVPARSPCPFDWIPDEIIEYIFFIGTEFDPLNSDTESDGEPWDHSDPYRRLPYELTASVQLTCRRFHRITKTPIAAKLYYIAASIQFPHKQRGLETQVVGFIDSLKRSNGCDIFADVELLSDACAPYSMRQLILHAMKMLFAHRTQVVALHLLVEDGAPLATGVGDWLGSNATQWKRLQYVRILNEKPEENSSAPQANLYDALRISKPSHVSYQHPSLGYFELENPYAKLIRDLVGIPNLHTLIIRSSKNNLPLEWPNLLWFLSYSRTIKRLDAAIQGAQTPPKFGMLQSHLEELNLVTDYPTLSTIFTDLIFSKLMRATVVAVPSISHAPPPTELSDAIMDFPSLEYLGFTNNTDQHIPFLSRCHTPILKKLSIAQMLKSIPGGASAYHEIEAVWVLLNHPSLNPRTLLERVDLRHVEILEFHIRYLWSWDYQKDDAESSPRPIPTDAMPRLRQISVRPVRLVQHALFWLRSHFIVKSSFRFTINEEEAHLEVSPVQDPHDPEHIFDISTLKVLDAFDNPYYGLVDELYRAVSREEKRESQYSYSLFAYPEQARHVVFNRVQELTIRLQGMLGYHQNFINPSVYANRWLCILSAPAPTGRFEDQPLFPSLRHITVEANSSDLGERFSLENLIELLNKILRVRQAASHPLESVNLVWYGKTKSPAPLEFSLSPGYPLSNGWNPSSAWSIVGDVQ